MKEKEEILLLKQIHKELGSIETGVRIISVIMLLILIGCVFVALNAILS